MRVVQKVTVRADPDMSQKGVGSWEKGTEIDILETRMGPSGSQLYRAVKVTGDGQQESSGSQVAVGWIKAKSSKNKQFVEDVVKPEPERQPEPEPEPEGY